MKNRKLVRDKVVSIVNGKNLVGVYFKDEPKKLLMECSPEKADNLINCWNDNEERYFVDKDGVTFNTEAFATQIRENPEGIIVDIFVRDGDLIDTFTFWNNDYYEDAHIKKVVSI